MGKAKANSMVHISFEDETQSIKSSTTGTWEITLESLFASSKAQTIIIQSEGQSLKLKNILIGDVWLAQANRIWR